MTTETTRCPTCGRRPSERFAGKVTGRVSLRYDETLIRTPCPDPCHDRADRVDELIKAQAKSVCERGYGPMLSTTHIGSKRDCGPYALKCRPCWARALLASIDAEGK